MEIQLTVAGNEQPFSANPLAIPRRISDSYRQIRNGTSNPHILTKITEEFPILVIQSEMRQAFRILLRKYPKVFPIIIVQSKLSLEL